MSISSEGVFERLVWTLGLAFFVAVAWVAGSLVPFYLGMGFNVLGPALPVLWLGLSAVAVAGIAWVGRHLSRGGLASPAGLWGGLAFVLVSRSLAAWAIDAPLISDFLEYHQLAMATAHGGPWLSELRPMGFPLLLAGSYALLGPAPWVGEALNVALGVATGGLLYALVATIADRGAATAALWLFACWPAHIFMTAVLGTEIAYGAAFLAALLALALVGARPAAWWVPLSAAAGGLLALSQYVRPTSLALVPACLIYLLILRRPWRQTLAAGGAFLAVFVATLAPVATWNHLHQGHWSLSTSTYGGWSLLVGTNQKHNGMWNVDDVALVRHLPDRSQQDAFAREEGWRRLTADPPAFAALAVRKFAILWAAEDFAVYWSLGTAPLKDDRLLVPLYLWCQTFYAGLYALACIGLWRLRGNMPPMWVFSLLGLFTLVGVHTMLEVQSRYHFNWTLLAIVGAAHSYRKHSIGAKLAA